VQFGIVTKRMFFDTKRVQSAMDKKTRRVLSRFGAFVRTRARSSIRSRDTISKPGRPPHSHTRVLKDLILFGYDRMRSSVVIGPLAASTRGAQALEEGGTITVKAARRGVKSRRVKIKARPFMGPAFEKEQANLPALWSGKL